MEDFRIELFPTHNEIAVLGNIDATLIRVIMEELRETPDFPNRHAVWTFADTISAPAFPEFGEIIALLRGFLRPDLPDKRVGLVVGGGLNRALVEMFSHEMVAAQALFRGDTALHKLFFDAARRYSEDIDLVQTHAQPAGRMMEALRTVLDPWLGAPRWKQTKGRVTLAPRSISSSNKLQAKDVAGHAWKTRRSWPVLCMVQHRK